MKNTARSASIQVLLWLLLSFTNIASAQCFPSSYTPISGPVTTSLSAGNYFIAGSVDISSAVTVSFDDAEIQVDPGASITVHNGGTLYINGSHLYSCTDMWPGIILETGGRLIIDQGTAHDNTLIEDADIAVKVLYFYDYVPSGQNALNVDNTIFNRNRIGIDFGTSKYEPTGPYPRFYPISIKNTIFTCRDIPFTIGSGVWTAYENFKNTTLTSSTTYPNTPSSFSSPYIEESNYSSINTNAYLKLPFTAKTKSQIGIKAATHDHFNGIYKIGEEVNTLTTNNVVIFDNQTTGIKLYISEATINNCTFQNTRGANLDTETYGILAENDDEEDLHLTTTASSGRPHNAFFDCKHAITANFYTHTVLDNNDIRSSKTEALGSVDDGLEGITIRASSYLWLSWNSEAFARNNNIKNIANAITLRFDDWPWLYYGSAPPGYVTFLGNTIEINNNYISSGNEDLTTPTPDFFCDQAINLEVVTPVYVYGSAVPPLHCLANEIHSARVGIRISGWEGKDLRVLNNLVHINNDGPLVTGYNDAQGILLQGNIPQQVLGNFIYNNRGTVYDYSGYSKVLANTRFLEMNNGLDYNVRCNTGTAAKFNITFAGIMPTVDFYTNTMAPDVVMGHGGNVGLTLNNAIIGSQGNASNACGNNYDDDANYFNPGGLKTFCNNSDATLSSMYVVNTVGNFQNPDNLSGTLGSPMSPYAFSNSSLLLAAAGTLENCEPIAERSSNNNSAMVNRQQNTFTIKLAEMEKTATGNIRLLGKDTVLKLYVAQLQLYRFLSSPNGVAAQSPLLQQFVAAGNNGSFGTMDKIIAALGKHDSTLVKQLLNSWNKTNRVDSNYAKFFNWTLQKILRKSIDLTEVETLANACPQTDGNVVFWIQNLYNAITNEHRIFTSPCGISGSQIPDNTQNKYIAKPTTKTVENNAVNIYPNPATNDVKVKGSNITNIEVYNMYGAKVYASQRYNYKGEVAVNFTVKNLPQGLYIVKVYDSKNVVASHKLVKQ